MLAPAPGVPPPPAARLWGSKAEEGAEGRGLVRVWTGLGGTRWVWGRRAHLPLVSAAIAGHMTVAVAGMTVRALATRGREGGDPKKVEGDAGCTLREKREDSTLSPGG